MRRRASIVLVGAWLGMACGSGSSADESGSSGGADTTSSTSAQSSGLGSSSSGGSGAVEVHGHRGDRGNVPPGNTLPSFVSALSYGVDALEGDLRITADGAIVFGHDDSLTTTGCSWSGTGEPPQTRISEMTADDVAMWDCHDELDGIQAPPRLGDVLALDDAVAFNLEFKLWTEADADAYMAALLAFDEACAGCLAGRVTLQSFEWPALAYTRETYGPQLAFRVSLIALVPRPDLEAARAYADVWSPTKELATPEAIAEAQSWGYVVLPWTVNEPDEMQSLIDAGVDGMITDHPDVLLDLLGRG